MIRKYVVPLLAAAGFTFAIWTVVMGSKPMPVAQPVAQPAQAPFHAYVAGAGIVESSTENIAVGTPVSGIVTAVLVRVGSAVEAGEPLFKLDDRALQAELAVQQTALRLARAKLSRLTQLPRPEDIPPAAARVREAEAAWADAKDQLRVLVNLTDKRGIRKDDISRRRFAVQVAAAQLTEARAQLALLQAGSWQPDIAIAQAEVAAAEAQVQTIRTDIERLTICAPVAGQLLQVNIRVGEFAQTGILQTPLMLVGNVDRLHVYSFERRALPVYVGQQMDVFIEAPPPDNAAAVTTPTPADDPKRARGRL